MISERDRLEKFLILELLGISMEEEREVTENSIVDGLRDFGLVRIGGCVLWIHQRCSASGARAAPTL